jgi:hypothetical protein
LAASKPSEAGLRLERAQATFYATGSQQELAKLFLDKEGDQVEELELARLQLEAAWTLGDAAKVIRAGAALRAAGGTLLELQQIKVGAALLAAGDEAQAHAVLTAVRTQLEEKVERQPGNATAWDNLAATCGLLEDGHAAVAAARQATDLISLEQDARLGAHTEMTRAIVEARFGDPQQAVRDVARLLALPGDPDLNVHHLRVGLEWAGIRERADFKSLLDDPTNNAPLY